VSIFQNKLFFISLGLFILLNTFLYVFIIYFSSVLPINLENYVGKSHHFFQDTRVENNSFNYIRDIGVWDAQWYLKIATNGYPARKEFERYTSATQMGGLTYAFFPFYPILLSIENTLFSNIEMTAFVFSNLLLLMNFVSLYYVITKLYSSNIAVRSIFLLFLFPFSIFFRSYFTEGLFLFLLIWFSYFMIKNRWLSATVILSLLFVTKPNALPLGIAFMYFLYWGVRQKKIKFLTAILYLLFGILPFLWWLQFCFTQTGNPLYWNEVQSVWFQSSSLFYPIKHNVSLILSFWKLPLHSWHESKVDTFVVLASLFIVIFGKKVLKPQLWLIIFLLVVVPLFDKDMMSYSRYQSVSFPLFLYLGLKIKGIPFYLLCGVFLILLCVCSLFLVNWYWVA
jgi:Gpi18-like mannosyltransferase